MSVLDVARGSIVWSAADPEPVDRFFCNLGRAGDVDADGMPDVLVGCNSPPQVTLHSGLNGEVLWRLDLDEDNWGKTRRVGGAGDVDGDGANDFFAGLAYSESVSGPSVVLFSGSTGRSLARILAPESATPWFGIAAAGGDDLNGDGRPDLVVGSPFASLFGGAPPPFPSVIAYRCGAPD